MTWAPAVVDVATFTATVSAPPSKLHTSKDKEVQSTLKWAPSRIVCLHRCAISASEGQGMLKHMDMTWSINNQQSPKYAKACISKTHAFQFLCNVIQLIAGLANGARKDGRCFGQPPRECVVMGCLGSNCALGECVVVGHLCMYLLNI
jgi:hypothetical protein